MIGKQDIIDRAAEWQLRPDVVEKDYALGWLLAALAEHPETSQQWVFKGGTCLKKCYFETYRFSEDLDFSLLPGARYTEGELLAALRQVATRAAELSGVDFPADDVVVIARQNLRGQPTFEVRLPYRGPLAIPTSQRIRLDLTRNEPVLDGVAQRPIFHAFPDALPDALTVATYSIDELFAEKLRALVERTRPRDLYDVVFILENRPEALDLDRARELFSEKCKVKQVARPTCQALQGIIDAAVELRSEWANMLAHQLPTLPPLAPILPRLPGLLAWLDQPEVSPRTSLSAVQVTAGQELVAVAGLQYWGTGVGLEAVRFAGTNRLLVEFSYNGRLRHVEPYSLRRATTGNLLLYAWEQGSTHIKAFDVSRMSGLRATSIPFTPRYRVEFTAAGPFSTPEVRRRPSASAWSMPTIGHTARLATTRARTRSGVTYVYKCPLCDKKFHHATMSPTLRPHKDRSGAPCYGRYGVYVDTRYR